MASQAWIIMTSAQKDDAVALNDEAAMIEPRQIDNLLANNLGEGVLLGKYVAPARLLNDAAYARWINTLGGLPIRSMDPDVLFTPSPLFI